MASPVALNIAAVGAGFHALPVLESMLATLHMACRTLLHLLSVMARVLDLLMAELAFHDGLLLQHEQEANVEAKSGFRSSNICFMARLRVSALQSQP
jgi:hypothetical protein